MKDCKALEKLLTISLESIYRKVQCMLYTHHLQQMVCHMATWCWNAEMAKLTTAGSPNVPQQKSVLPSNLPQWSGNDNLSTVKLPKNDEPLDFLNGERKLHGGDMIEWDDCTLPEVLVSTLQTMSSCVKLCRVLALQPKQVYIYQTRQAWTWKTVSSPTQLTIIFAGCVPCYFQTVLFADLGGGGECG